MRDLKIWTLRDDSVLRSQNPLNISSMKSNGYDHSLSIQDRGQVNIENLIFEAIEGHIHQYVGPSQKIAREKISNRLFVDIHLVPPSLERPFNTLVTIGMSSQPMITPPGLETFRFTELTLCLPAEWPIDRDNFEDEANYWPVRWLKIMARFPHLYQTWLWSSHTVPNGDPPKAYAANTRLCCMMLSNPVLLGEVFREVPLNPEKTIYFHSIIPIYKEEMELKLKKGYDVLLKKLYSVGVNELLDINRVNVGRKWWHR